MRTPGRWRNLRTRKARIEIIPLIDVMFLLLCFFVYATMNLVIQQGIFVDLATAKSAQGTGDEAYLAVSVTRDGRYYLDKKPLTEAQLTRALENMQKKGNRQMIMVNADQDAKHGQVIRLLDLVRQSGVRTAVFAVEPDESLTAK